MNKVEHFIQHSKNHGANESNIQHPTLMLDVGCWTCLRPSYRLSVVSSEWPKGIIVMLPWVLQLIYSINVFNISKHTKRVPYVHKQFDWIRVDSNFVTIKCVKSCFSG